MRVPSREDGSGSTSSLGRAVRRYWDAHPVATDSAPFERGTKEQFDAIYHRWQSHGTTHRREFLESCRTGRVLEVGCGLSMDGRFLSENDVDYQAVDLSFESLKLANQHFRQNDLRRRFTNADATRLPFQDGTFDLVFSIGALHHVPDTPVACREVARVLRSHGTLRVMFYNRHSYHVFLVSYVVRPLIWMFLRLPLGERLVRLGPSKLRGMYEISREHGFSTRRLLSISTDTSAAGEDNFNPHSSFYTEQEIRDLFDGFEDFKFWKTDLRYFPLPWLRRFVERRFGFFIQMTARKSAAI